MLNPRLPRRSIGAGDLPTIAAQPVQALARIAAETARAPAPSRGPPRCPPPANVLSQKLRHGGVARSPLADTDLLGETFARGVEDRMRLLVKTMIGTTVGARPGHQARRRHRRRSPAPAMLGLVDVEDADTPGLIALESDLAYHLIDLTLGGDPVQAPEPVARPFTAIDMALCRLHLDAILAAFAHAIGANLGRPLTKGLTIRDLRQNLVAAAPRARLYRRAGLRHGPHPRRGRAARPLHADPAALGARRDPRLDPGPQRPGRRATGRTTSGRR